MPLASRHDDEQWAPVSDLMAVIMLVFMLITMLLFVTFNLEGQKNKNNCKQSYDLLKNEFKGDFEKWEAVLEPDLTIRFENEKVLFAEFSSKVKPVFADRLRNFFPRYMEVIEDIKKIGEKEEDEVLAIRIEGHTSSGYQNLGKRDAYIKNMELSQDRARKILQYVLDPKKVPGDNGAGHYGKTARRLITANGLSSSKLRCTDGVENKEQSRRVEFKLLTNSCQKAGFYDKNRVQPEANCFSEGV